MIVTVPFIPGHKVARVSSHCLNLVKVIATVPFIPGHEAAGVVVAKGAACKVDIGARYTT